jgi:hypothetical protein
MLPASAARTSTTDHLASAQEIRALAAMWKGRSSHSKKDQTEKKKAAN